LKRQWDARARSPARDFFVASIPGWDDPEHWHAQARLDVASLLHDVPDRTAAGFDVLEIGCGVGRLAAELAPRCRTYTGVDVECFDEPRFNQARDHSAGCHCG
jgi:SAM-dependent methyltransferase